MKGPESFDVQEPKIQRDEILAVKDKYFRRRTIAIVTGAASGIGRATAVALSANGLTVVGVDIDEKGGQGTAEQGKESGGKIIFIKADLTKDEEMEHCVRQAAQQGSLEEGAPAPGQLSHQW